MRERRGFWLALAAVLAAAISLQAADPEAAPPRKRRGKAKTEDAAVEGAIASSVDKKRFELYLRDRVNRIKEHHKGRMDFFAREAEAWNASWNKIRDERQLFEIRSTRQTLNLFESLASLDPRDHAATLADFERMHATVVRSFEIQQKQKMQEFFTERESRWKDFAADQEKERSDFLAEAQAGWEEHKASLRAEPGLNRGSEEAGGREDEPREEASRRPTRPAPRSAAPSRSRSSLEESEDKWH